MSLRNFFSGMAWLSGNLTIFLSLIFVFLGTTLIYANNWIDAPIVHLLWLGVGLTGFVLFFVILIQLTYANNWAGAPIVIKPIHDGKIEVGLIFIQGEGIPIKRYYPMATAIQESAPDLKIWVGIPQFISDAPIPRETGLAVDKVISEMKKEGMNTDNIFFAAHSVGGVAIQKYLKSHPDKAKGQILMGSFLSRSYFSKMNEEGNNILDYPIPTLTIGGTLDGLARITRIASAFWYQQINLAKSTDVENFPVVVIDGATHMQFASGEPTSYVADFDLKPRISYQEVHRQVGDLVLNFMSSRLQGDNSESSLQFLNAKRQETQSLIMPILDAFLMEGYNGFKPPCYNRAEDNTRDDPKCTPYSPWIQNDANQIMAGIDECPIDFSLNVIDSFHRSSTFDPFHEPHVHIPQIRNSCNGTEDCTLTITSVTQALYNLPDVFDFDTGFFPISAFSLRTKLNSRQNLWKHAGVKEPNFEETDGPSRGAQINQQAYNWALEHAGNEAKSYFQECGVQMVMGEDILPPFAAEPIWLRNYPKYTYINQANEQVYQVRSTTMKTDINYPISAASGFHYCQLLSPAAAMEWIYIDGLRPKASLSGITFTYGPLSGMDKIIRLLLRAFFRQTRTKGLLPRI